MSTTKKASNLTGYEQLVISIIKRETHWREGCEKGTYNNTPYVNDAIDSLLEKGLITETNGILELA